MANHNCFLHLILVVFLQLLAVSICVHYRLWFLKFNYLRFLVLFNICAWALWKFQPHNNNILKLFFFPSASICHNAIFRVGNSVSWMPFKWWKTWIWTWSLVVTKIASVLDKLNVSVFILLRHRFMFLSKNISSCIIKYFHSILLDLRRY